MADNFDIAGRKQNVERDSFKNLAAMRDYDPNYLPNIFIATCEETNTLYLYNVKNEVDATTGKWRAISIDGYTKDEVDEMFSQLTGLKGEIVTSLPTENISLNTIYMVPHATKENSYIQFMYINGAWANIGSTDIDLTNYATKEDLDKKVDKEDGLGLSQNNLTDELVFEIEKIKDKVDKEDNKGLSTNDLTDDLLAEINKIKDKQDALVAGKNIVIDPETNEISASGELETDASSITYEDEGHPTWTDVDKALKGIIAKIEYVKPEIKSFTSDAASIYEIGQKIASIVFNWTLNKEITSISLTGCTVEVTDTTATYDTEVSANKTFTLTVGDGENTATKSISIAFRNKMYFGGAEEPASYDSSFILGLAKSQFATSKSGSFTVNVGANQYGYLAFPKSFGNLTSVKIGGFDTDVINCGDIEFTNASGGKTTYSIYRTGRSGLGEITMVVA